MSRGTKRTGYEIMMVPNSYFTQKMTPKMWFNVTEMRIVCRWLKEFLFSKLAVGCRFPVKIHMGCLMLTVITKNKYIYYIITMYVSNVSFLVYDVPTSNSSNVVN